MNVVDAWTCVGPRPEDDRPMDAATLLHEMDRAGVAEALCTHFAAVRYDMRTGNDEMQALSQAHPRLHPIAVVNPAPYLGVAEEIRRCAQAGCVGVRLMPGAQSWSLESVSLLSALLVAESLGLPITVEVSASGDATHIAQSVRGFGVPVILANVTYTTMGEAIAAMERNAHLCLEASRLGPPGVVEILVQTVGVERLLFGSGAPYWEIVPTLRIIQAAAIPDDAKEAILERNARRIFHLPEAQPEAGRGES